MTLTILVSFSLLTLVVTARPILPQDGPQVNGPSAALQDVVQAIFQARARQSPECLSCESEDEIRIQFTSAEEQKDVLSALDDLDAIKGVVPIDLDGVLTDEEKKLYDILGSPRPGAGLNDLDGGERPLPEDVASLDATADASEDVYARTNHLMPPRHFLVLTFSCIAALLAMGCIGIALYALHYFRKRTALYMEWEMIPRVEARDAVEIVVDEHFAGRFRDDKPSSQVVASERPSSTPPVIVAATSDLEEAAAENPDLIVFDLYPDSDSDSDSDSDGEDFDEGFHDAEEPSLLFVEATDPEKREVPVIIIEEQDPDYLPLPAFRSPTPYSTPPPTPPRSPYRRIVEMREATSRPSSPVSKPAWSLRASDAPSLGLTSSSGSAPLPLPLPKRTLTSSPAQHQTMLSIPGSLPITEDTEVEMVERPGARRAYRTPLPELDIAFAMQLRPGLGLGSDPAWIVRFMMAMFGWMTVLLGGGGGLVMRRDRRAIA